MEWLLIKDLGAIVTSEKRPRPFKFVEGEEEENA